MLKITQLHKKFTQKNYMKNMKSSKSTVLMKMTAKMSFANVSILNQPAKVVLMKMQKKKIQSNKNQQKFRSEKKNPLKMDLFINVKICWKWIGQSQREKAKRQKKRAIKMR